jgi:ACR3 family arsenite transporter
LEEKTEEKKALSTFDKYLSIWVALCMAVGIILGVKFPQTVSFLGKLSIAQVSIPIAVVLWIMIFPMMVQIDFTQIKSVRKEPIPLYITLFVNWIIKPFSMYLLSVLFFKFLFRPFITGENAQGFVAGAVLLGAAPCTAMVFVWSYLSGGDPLYTLVQVAVNDLVVIVAFAPIVKFLLGLNKMVVPYSTIFYSVVIYVLIPVVLGYAARRHFIRTRGIDWLDNVFVKNMKNITMAGLLATLIVIFMFQGKIIVSNPFSIFLVMIPLILQTYFIFFVGILLTKLFKIRYELAAPAAMIGASNFFELAVATAVILFGLSSPATLATVVGVLVEVPIMLSLVAIFKANKKSFDFDGKSAAKAFVHEGVLPGASNKDINE